MANLESGVTHEGTHDIHALIAGAETTGKATPGARLIRGDCATAIIPTQFGGRENGREPRATAPTIAVHGLIPR